MTFLLVLLWLAQGPQAILDRAVAQFEAGRFTESAAEFDRLANAVPGQAPYLWQRGIALYYAGRYDDCRRQFESHRSVNPGDVENAAWHFLCVARAESPAAARAALLPVESDPRVPMREIYQMLRGTLRPEQVLSAAGPQPEAQFYGHLYVGLYFEALDMKDRAREHITIAAADRFERYGGYMHRVTRVHLRTMTAARPFGARVPETGASAARVVADGTVSEIPPSSRIGG
jgi:lipoprotein NlpI